MPQFDKRRSVEVPIEAEPAESLKNLIVPGRVSLALITDGKAVVRLNGAVMTINAQSAMCLSENDALEVIEGNRLYAQSFRLAPLFLKNRAAWQYFKQAKSGGATSDDRLQADVLDLFYRRDAAYNGVLGLTPQTYIRVFEWLCVIGTETRAQSDGRWTCRVRSYFLMILNLLDEACAAGERPYGGETAESPVDAALEHIHSHYMENLSLDALCRLTNVNRTTLNTRFKLRTGQSVIEYLLNYRLRTASELLAHTGLTIDEIARRTGFGYDTYLIRRFSAKTGKTPTEYRKDSRAQNNIVIEKE